MIDVTGKLPKSIIDNLEKLDVIVDDVQIAGDDIDITLTKDNLKTYLYGVYIGDNKWNVEEIDDNANLFPEVEEGDVVSADLITKLFTNIITSSLILSFNPLGKIKYGIKDVAGKVADVAKSVGRWATDTMTAQEAEDFLRTKGPFKYSYVDPRDNRKTTAKFNASGINLGKLEYLGKMGHFKALTGNPGTQDFQVWHLYKNGNKLRVLDLKPGLEEKEAVWVYDNNIPQTWTEADWNPDVQEESNVTENQTEESNVTEGQTEENQTEESNVTEGKNASENANEDFEDDDEIWETQLENIQSSVETNVIEGKQKKSKYNGCNVTGCEDGTFGPMVASNLISTIGSEQIIL